MHKGGEYGYVTDERQLEKNAASLNQGFQQDPVVAKRATWKGKCLGGGKG